MNRHVERMAKSYSFDPCDVEFLGNGENFYGSERAATRSSAKGSQESPSGVGGIARFSRLLVGEVGFEPTRPVRPADFKSASSAGSDTRPGVRSRRAGWQPARRTEWGRCDPNVRWLPGCTLAA